MTQPPNHGTLASYLEACGAQRTRPIVLFTGWQTLLTRGMPLSRCHRLRRQEGSGQPLHGTHVEREEREATFADYYTRWLSSP